MEERYYVYILLVSFLMTYPIRSIPALFISKLNLSPFWQRFLDLVPYTALTSAPPSIRRSTMFRTAP